MPSPPLIAVILCAVFIAAWQLVPHPAIIVVAGLAPLAIYGVLKQPFIIILTFVIFSFCRIHEAFPFLNPLKIPQLLALAALFALAWHMVISGKIKPFWDKTLTWIAGLPQASETS